MLCVLFETRSEIAVGLFGGVFMKSQISLVSQREVEPMKKLILFSILQESLQFGCRSGKKSGDFKVAIKCYLYSIIFSTKKNISFHLCSLQFHIFKKKVSTYEFNSWTLHLMHLTLTSSLIQDVDVANGIFLRFSSQLLSECCVPCFPKHSSVQ